jgi:hypothetical protein
MGVEHVKDKKGRSARKYYSARICENVQLVMKWDDQNAERPFYGSVSGESQKRRFGAVLSACN